MSYKPQIHLLRHAQATHNTFPRNQNIHDPPLTALGLEESAKIIDTFPWHSNVGLILTSPLRRAIQTALGGYSHIIDAPNGAELRIYKNLQPGRDLPCDTGSPSSTLISEFPDLDFSSLEDGWAERGILKTDEEQAEKAQEVLRDLKGLLEGLEKKGEKRDVVLVTHGINYEYLDPEAEGRDWGRAGWKSYSLEGGEEGGLKLVLVQKHNEGS